ncbi:MAG: type II toxin-antitoxin system VapC family toxin [Gemmatimonadetes bacterium]|nr:type II toxin-antitoxin system VapC family toxin [Gemmatimonadota bacterium]
MILVDANILMYAAGAPHPHKAPSARWLEAVARGEVDAAVNAETLQELLHRYRAIGRWSDGRRVYDLARTIFPAVVPITAAVLDEARRLLDRHPMLMARDGLHAAVVLVEGFEAICSYDRDFDLIPGVRRMEP